MNRHLVRTVAAAGVTLLLSCAPSHPPVGVVTGKITCKGKPVNYGSVMFVPAQGGTAATASVEPDGTYRLSTFGTGDGALVGEHKVVVEVFRIIPRPGNRDGDDAVPVAHKKYYRESTTPLRATVQAGANVLDFDLQ